MKNVMLLCCGLITISLMGCSTLAEKRVETLADGTKIYTMKADRGTKAEFEGGGKIESELLLRIPDIGYLGKP